MWSAGKSSVSYTTHTCLYPLTDIARYRSIDPRITIHNWFRSRDIVEFLGLWEELHNPDFKRVEFDTFKTYAGTNAFVFSIKGWTEQLGAIGLFSKSGRYGGGIYVHTDSIKENLIPRELTPEQVSFTYESEADLLNTVLFGMTAKEWRGSNPNEKGDIRDNATLYQLLVLANMESYNAILIKQGNPKLKGCSCYMN